MAFLGRKQWSEKSDVLYGPFNKDQNTVGSTLRAPTHGNTLI